MMLGRRGLLLLTIAAWLILGFMVALVVWQLLYSPQTERLTSLVPVIVVGIICAVATLFLVTPKLVLMNTYSGGHEKGAKERFDIENETRKTLALILGGASFLTGSYFSWQQYQMSQRKDTDELTSKSVDQLSHKDVSVRLGGLRGLQAVLDRDPGKYDEVMGYMIAYLHDHFGANLQEAKGACAEDENLLPGKNLNQARVYSVGIVTAPDLQRVAKFLSTRAKPGSDAAPTDLSQLNLCGVTLTQGHLEHAFFDMSNLRRGNFQSNFLDHAEMEGVDANALLISSIPRPTQFNCSWMRSANMRSGHFQGALFSHADLQDSFLEGADLSGASFSKTDLRDADLIGANLHGARFAGANLRGVKLDTKTDFSGADLSGALGICKDDLMKSGVITDKDTQFPSKCVETPAWQEDPCLPTDDGHKRSGKD